MKVVIKINSDFQQNLDCIVHLLIDEKIYSHRAVAYTRGFNLDIGVHVASYLIIMSTFNVVTINIGSELRGSV